MDRYHIWGEKAVVSGEIDRPDSIEVFENRCLTGAEVNGKTNAKTLGSIAQCAKLGWRRGSKTVGCQHRADSTSRLGFLVLGKPDCL